MLGNNCLLFFPQANLASILRGGPSWIQAAELMMPPHNQPGRMMAQYFYQDFFNQDEEGSFRLSQQPLIRFLQSVQGISILPF